MLAIAHEYFRGTDVLEDMEGLERTHDCGFKLRETRRDLCALLGE